MFNSSRDLLNSVGFGLAVLGDFELRSLKLKLLHWLCFGWTAFSGPGLVYTLEGLSKDWCLAADFCWFKIDMFPCIKE